MILFQNTHGCYNQDFRVVFPSISAPPAKKHARSKYKWLKAHTILSMFKNYTHVIDINLSYILSLPSGFRERFRTDAPSSDRNTC